MILIIAGALYLAFGLLISGKEYFKQIRYNVKMEKSKANAQKFAYNSGAKRFKYIGGNRDIWRFIYPDGTEQLKTGDELENEAGA